MNAVIDTNILVSAFAIGGKPAQVLELAIGEHISAVTSEKLLAELLRVLKRKFHFNAQQLSDVEQIIREKFTVVIPSYIPEVVTRDPDDNHVLAIVHAVKADIIISGDSDLLTLEQYKVTPIITADMFLTQYKF